MKRIPLTKGQYTIVDDDSYDDLSRLKWQASRRSNGQYYAVHSYSVQGMRGAAPMHRLITWAPPGVEVDHINGDSLDNRRENLRLCSRWQNSCNRRFPTTLSGYRGVYKHRRKWKSTITPRGKRIVIGIFSTKEEAARAYNKAAVEHFGDFAVLNEVS